MQHRLNRSPQLRATYSTNPGFTHSTNRPAGSPFRLIQQTDHPTNMKISALILIGAFACAATLATAQDQGKPNRPDRPDRGEKGPPGGRGERPVPPEILEKFDLDKDGKLSPEERKAAREAREKEFDKDGDGKLNEQEREAMRDANRAKMLERFDKDGDGKLSEEEKQSMPRPPRGEGRPEGDKGGKGPRDGANGKKGGDRPQGKP
jgi:hypothetical protein